MQGKQSELKLQEQEMTVQDIIDRLTGLDTDGDAKAAITIGIVEYQKDDADPEIINQATLHNAYLSSLAYPGNYVMAEIEFKLMSNSWLASFCEMVSEFHHMSNKMDYGFIMTVAGLKDDAEYFLSLECPLICMQGYSKVSKKPTMLQTLFPLDGVSIYPVEYSLSEIRAEVGRELVGQQGEMADGISDINEQIKDSYGINQELFLHAGKKECAGSLDKHMHVTKY